MTVDGDLVAWALADVARSLLNMRHRHQLYIALGTREFFPAIRIALDAVVRHEVPIASETIAQLTLWLDRFPDHEDALALRSLIGMAKRLPPKPAALVHPPAGHCLDVAPQYRRTC